MSAPPHSDGRTRRKARTHAAAARQSRPPALDQFCPRGRSHQIIHQIVSHSIAGLNLHRLPNNRAHCALDRGITETFRNAFCNRVNKLLRIDAALCCLSTDRIAAHQSSCEFPHWAAPTRLCFRERFDVLEPSLLQELLDYRRIVKAKRDLAKARRIVIEKRPDRCVRNLAERIRLE